MKILEPVFFFDQMSATMSKPSEPSSTDLCDGETQLFEDPDSAYEYWLKQDCFETSNKQHLKKLIEKMIAANEIQLNLQKESSPNFIAPLMKQHSIQITLPEALLINQHFNRQHNQSKSWDLTYTYDAQTKIANHKLSQKQTSINIQYQTGSNKIRTIQNNTCNGTFRVDIEGKFMEKIHGKFNNKSFILDPIWKQHQHIIDSEKIMLGEFKTEIVHHPKHKRTLWRGQQNSNFMLMKNNKTYQVNLNLFLNKKQLEWPTFKLTAYQWFCPWQLLPIAGQYYLRY